MVFVLPRANDALPQIEQRLSSERLAGWLGALDDRLVDVRIPRFEFDLKTRVEEHLRVLGMKQAFDPVNADFTGMTAADRFYIGFVLHGAEIEVNEEGTVAAAATVWGAEGAGPPLEEEPVVFDADHPFLFLIRHEASGAILFIGRFTGPD